ncbi:CidA/LrgA family protein [Burkholderia sp. 22PA0106]|uniref:CidA/LrgA family protein n=1 Tax=Burkholderia sp. 22PA0106 TaxID=3237371 RepID=UPI0039C38C9B
MPKFTPATVSSAPAPEPTAPVRSAPAGALRRGLRIVWQAGALAALWAVLDQLVRAFSLPIPAGILGMAAVLALLMSGRLAPAAVKDGANWLLTDMLLFFIPATVAAVQYGGLFRANGWQLALLLVVGTAFVMCVVALAVEQAARLERRLERGRRARAARQIRKTREIRQAREAREALAQRGRPAA